MKKNTKSTLKICGSVKSEKYFRLIITFFEKQYFVYKRFAPKMPHFKVIIFLESGESIHIKEGIFITLDYARLWPASLASSV